ncbi:AraC family transcriptional regulator [Paraburkholderia sp. J10-1]|uniref:helix-turn-helix transcriptional regulator n=1 Tax=Paraburkholderia sp. J10-1 TaxID=2805430 RepID=UPI002AB7C03E|nr:AraC family transcriptional regulator [Paraburkholderia sp. J10-1]
MLRVLEPGDYFGTTTLQYGDDGISVVETHFATDLIIPQHEHVNPFFCFVLDGRGTRSWPTRRGEDGPMSLTFFPAGVPHANCWYGSGGRALHLEFSPAWLQRLGGRTRVLDRPDDFASGTPLSFMRRLVRECREQDSATPLAVEGLVLELLAACERSVPRAATVVGARRWLGRVEALLHDRFRESLTLDEIASDNHVCADHLAREFRKHFGCTVGEYVRQLRLDFACDQLIRGHDSLAAIAQAAGFTDQSHFTRVFRRRMGLTPGAYRAQLLEHRSRTKD